MHHLSARLPFFKCHQRSESNKSKRRRSSSRTLFLCTAGALSRKRQTEIDPDESSSSLCCFDLRLAPVRLLGAPRFLAHRFGLRRRLSCSDRLQIEINVCCFSFILYRNQYRVSFSPWWNDCFLLKLYKSNCARLLWNVAAFWDENPVKKYFFKKAARNAKNYFCLCRFNYEFWWI